MEIFLRLMQMLLGGNRAMSLCKHLSINVRKTILTEHGPVHDVGVAEADLDRMQCVLDVFDHQRYHRVDEHDVAVLMQGHLESKRAGLWVVLQYHLLPFDRKRRACCV